MICGDDIYQEITSPRFFIVGAGGLGREVYGWILPPWPRQSQNQEHLLGFVDDAPDASLERFGIRQRVYSLEVAAKEYPGSGFVLAVGSPASRESLFDRLLSAGLKPLSFISDDAKIGYNSNVGPGSILAPGTSLTHGVQVGMGVLLNTGVRVGHEARIGDFSCLLGTCTINGEVVIGQRVLVGSGVVIHPRVEVGDDVTIGIGAVVIRKVRSGVTVFGNPAVKLK